MTPQLSFSAKLYQERRIPASQPTLRRPGPNLALGQSITHTLPLAPPLPLPEIVYEETRNVTPAGRTEPWVHGAEEV